MAKAGAEITVYIAGQLAFTGTVDKREGTGTRRHKNERFSTPARRRHQQRAAATSTSGTTSVNIGPNEYTIKLSARGKTKRLIDARTSIRPPT